LHPQVVRRGEHPRIPSTPLKRSGNDIITDIDEVDAASLWATSYSRPQVMAAK
jgi:hypothetical protein